MAVVLLAATRVAAQQSDDPSTHSFEGTGKIVTPPFSVADRWQLRWTQVGTVNITLAQTNGVIVAGATASGDGSLYFPHGGIFYLVVSGTPRGGAATYHFSIVQLNPYSTSAEGYTPSRSLPQPSRALDGSVQVVPETRTAANRAPTTSESRATVQIIGDTGRADGFLTHAPDGAPVVVTDSHIISDNPNFKIETTDGRTVTVLGYRGAPDREAIMLMIKDDGFVFLDLAAKIDLVPPGEFYLIPCNVGGGEVYLGASGQVKSVEPDRIQISTPVFRGPLGAPVIDSLTGKVLGATCIDLPNPVDVMNAPSQTDPKGVIADMDRRFAVRVDNVANWETYDWNKFLAESRVLEAFHGESRMLDSFLNGERYQKARLPVSNGAEGFLPAPQLYLKDDKIRALAQAYRLHMADPDKSLQMEAVRELAAGLTEIANNGLSGMQNVQGFYQFNRRCAASEVAYRKALLDEIDKAGDNVGDSVH